ncbi:TonB-dependent receptor plug domain-containing protein [Thiolapillus sp.]|uniref:TonB-dependent receptor plug domain-containing protein n=4 Tax=Thiolapillus sp. TaxID=2017437 RepID=UPI003AF7E55B
MKKKQILPFVICSSLCATGVAADQEDKKEDTEAMPEMVVQGTRLNDISGKEVKSADLAEALAKKSASVSLVRRSGIANDIILRGQKKDNINILIDGGKIYGACPNRMDPPTSHILTNNIESVEITEGPYDVENFGTLSGAVKITTKEPEEGMHGEVSLNVGSWNYLKGAATLTGGTDRVRAMASISRESSDQYEDGDGNDFAEQIENYDPTSKGRYQDKYRDLEAYEKSTFMGKLFVDITENQELKLSYTANRSDDVLYPSSPMDAIYDDPDIFDVQYVISDLGIWSRELSFQYYNSQVDHPMSNRYRLSSGPGSVNEKTHHLETEMQGAKVKNSWDLSDGTVMTVGLDFSRRNWDGAFEGKGMAAKIDGFVSIDDVDTDNAAIFVEAEKNIESFNLKLGARYDDTTIEPAGTQPSNDYSALSAFAFGTYGLQDGLKLFGGVGRSARVPDARELYLRFPTAGGVLIGNPDLDQVINTEIDLGMELNAGSLYIKPKVFYSWLGDFIVYNDSKMMRRFDNVDATLYGFSVDGSWNFTDQIYLDFGLAWQRGEKDKAQPGQTDRDLPEIPPLKGTLALNWEYLDDSLARAEVVAADNWTRYDADNGEQELDSWAVLNLKVDHALTKNINLVLGVDNVFDETYAVSNTYKDLTLLEGGGGDVILMNEPGRYFYLNAAYRF